MRSKDIQPATPSHGREIDVLVLAPEMFHVTHVLRFNAGNDDFRCTFSQENQEEGSFKGLIFKARQVINAVLRSYEKRIDTGLSDQVADLLNTAGVLCGTHANPPPTFAEVVNT